MMTKINVSKIIKDHISTLKIYESRTDAEYDKGNYNLDDIFLFFIFPLLISGILIYLNLMLVKDLLNVLITALAIFAALLFNLLLLIYDIMPKVKASKDQLKKKYIKQIYSNISFCILIAIVTVILLIVIYIDGNIDHNTYNTNTEYIIYILTFIVYSLLFHFLFTLLMVLKRVHILLSKEFDN